MDDAPYGAYAVNLEQTIWYWNPSAERITGHKALDIIGRPCFQVIQNLAEYEDAPACQDGCPSLKATKEGRIPVSYDVWMLCASGQRKRVILTPLVIGATEVSGTVLVHLFHDSGNRAGAERVAGTVDTVLGPRTVRATPESPEEEKQLTPRELEVLRVVVLGLSAHEIADALHISYHTVRNHTANLRRKLRARNNFALLRNAQEGGLV